MNINDLIGLLVTHSSQWPKKDMNGFTFYMNTGKGYIEA